MNERGGIIGWFARNPVASNLVMIGIVVTGAATVLSGRLNMEVFPDFQPNVVTVAERRALIYPWAR